MFDSASFYVFLFHVWSKVDIPSCLRHSTDREVALMMLMAYLSYMLAEVRSYIQSLLMLYS